jgi:hypothetical protein
MLGDYHVARKARFEAKAQEQSRAGSGGCRVVGDAGERSIPSNNSVREKLGSKRKRRSKVVPVLGAAGLSLSLASGASAATGGPAADMLTRNTGVSHEITLREEEVSDVSLATFYVFDKENPGTFRPAYVLPWAPAAAAGRAPITLRQGPEMMLIDRRLIR